jgi:ABC-type lipoprotein export system ATPase subunit
MIRTIKATNFRCFENFKIELGRQACLLGDNGSGKSTLLDVVRRLRTLVVEQGDVGAEFPDSTRTRWIKELRQSFEIVLSVGGRTFEYAIEIEHRDPTHVGDSRQANRIVAETLSVADDAGTTTRLYASKLVDGELVAALHRDDGSRGPDVMVNWSRSGIGWLDRRRDNQRLWQFKDLLSRVLVVRPTPSLMVAECKGQEARLAFDLRNFGAWYRHKAQESPSTITRLHLLLQKLWPHFVELRVQFVGSESAVLLTAWKSGSGHGRVEFTFDELSDGQRALIAVYALMAAAQDEEATLFLDEPDNYVALAEIQPLLFALEDEAALQTVVVSHHPEVIDRLAVEHGVLFLRPTGGNVETRAFSEGVGDSPLRASEIVARGWEQ